jgi:hypothetical protein
MRKDPNWFSYDIAGRELRIDRHLIGDRSYQVTHQSMFYKPLGTIKLFP